MNRPRVDPEVAKRFWKAYFDYHGDPVMEREYESPIYRKVPASSISNEDLFWLVGILEGEGWFGSNKNNNALYAYNPTISVQMSDRDIIEKAHKLLKSTEKLLISNHPYKNSKTLYQARIRGKPAAKWMAQLAPYMGERRREQIKNALNAWSKWKSRKK